MSRGRNRFTPPPWGFGPPPPPMLRMPAQRMVFEPPHRVNRDLIAIDELHTGGQMQIYRNFAKLLQQAETTREDTETMNSMNDVDELIFAVVKDSKDPELRSVRALDLIIKHLMQKFVMDNNLSPNTLYIHPHFVMQLRAHSNDISHGYNNRTKEVKGRWVNEESYLGLTIVPIYEERISVGCAVNYDGSGLVLLI